MEHEDSDFAAPNAMNSRFANLVIAHREMRNRATARASEKPAASAMEIASSSGSAAPKVKRSVSPHERDKADDDIYELEGSLHRSDSSNGGTGELQASSNRRVKETPSRNMLSARLTTSRMGSSESIATLPNAQRSSAVHAQVQVKQEPFADLGSEAKESSLSSGGTPFNHKVINHLRAFADASGRNVSFTADAGSPTPPNIEAAKAQEGPARHGATRGTAANLDHTYSMEPSERIDGLQAQADRIAYGPNVRRHSNELLASDEEDDEGDSEEDESHVGSPGSSTPRPAIEHLL
ncbi:hypothetical protein LTR85_011572 [Meristemomyces frigidus]|nr:hypothetical protein LTR85_011572 [Meristemomyces frigidus]